MAVNKLKFFSESSDLVVLPRLLHFSNLQDTGDGLRLVHWRRHLSESWSPEDDMPVLGARGRSVAFSGVFDRGMDDIRRQLRNWFLRWNPLRQRK